MVGYWFPSRPRSSSKPRKRAALSQHRPSRFSGLPILTTRYSYQSGWDQCSSAWKTHLQRAAHIVEDIDDNQDGHASIQLEQQPPFQLLPRLGATKLTI